MLDLFGFAVPGRRVLGPNRTNYGSSRSSRPSRGSELLRSQGALPDVAALGDDAEAVAQLLEPAGHLVGYSYGGCVALEVAHRYPERVRSLTLIEAPTFQLADLNAEVAATRSRFESVMADPPQDPAAYWEAFMAAGFGSPPIPPEAIPPRLKEASQREQVPWDVPLDLPKLSAAGIPTLVVVGGWDAGFTAAGRLVAEALDARLVEHTDADHFFFQSWPSIVQEAVRLWDAAEGRS